MRPSRIIIQHMDIIEQPEKGLAGMSLQDIRKQLRVAVVTLKEVQRDLIQMRELWLQEIAVQNALAGGDADSQKILKTMLRKMHTQSMNAKLNRITSGDRTGLDYIEVPRGEWFLLKQSGELYWYDQGVF